MWWHLRRLGAKPQRESDIYNDILLPMGEPAVQSINLCERNGHSSCDTDCADIGERFAWHDLQRQLSHPVLQWGLRVRVEMVLW